MTGSSAAHPVRRQVPPEGSTWRRRRVVP